MATRRKPKSYRRTREDNPYALAVLIVIVVVGALGHSVANMGSEAVVFFAVIVVLAVVFSLLYILTRSKKSESNVASFPEAIPVIPALKPTPSPIPMTSPSLAAQPKTVLSPVRTAIPSDDEIFELPIRKYFAKRGISRILYTRLAGVTFRNADRSERMPLICQLKEADQLWFNSDDTLPEFPNAIAVSWRGKQIGYLPDALAGEMRRDAKDNGLNWVCLFRRHTYHYETGNSDGAVLCMILLNPVPQAVPLPDAETSSSDAEPVKQDQPVTVSRIDALGADQEKTKEDIAFEANLASRFDRVIDKIIYDQLAAFEGENSDGTKRISVMRSCKAGELLLLKSAGSISSDVDVVSVHREYGPKLGYVEAGLAGELRRDGLRKWACVFRKKVFRPNTKSSSGAVLCLIRLGKKPKL